MVISLPNALESSLKRDRKLRAADATASVALGEKKCLGVEADDSGSRGQRFTGKLPMSVFEV